MGCGFSQRLATKEHHCCLHHPEHVVGAARSPPSGQERLPPRGSSCFPLFCHQPLSKGSAAALQSHLSSPGPWHVVDVVISWVWGAAYVVV